MFQNVDNLDLYFTYIYKAWCIHQILDFILLLSLSVLLLLFMSSKYLK